MNLLQLEQKLKQNQLILSEIVKGKRLEVTDLLKMQASV